MTKKICYILSYVHQSNELEWIINEVNKEYDLSVLLLNPLNDSQFNESQFEQYIRDKNIALKLLNYRGKKDIVKTFFKVFVHLIKTKPQIVHAQLFDASLIGMLASYFARIKHRIYTRHHSTFHHLFHPQVVKYDKLINGLSTKIIAVSKVVESVVIENEGALPEKVVTIHHGNNYDEIVFDADKMYSLKSKYNLLDNQPVIGVISRYIEWKGVQYIIPAFKQILNDFPNAKLVLAGIDGSYEDEIKKLLNDVPSNNYVEIRFEPDVWNLYKTFDVFVHAPINKNIEAFGQIYIEAMHSKIPMVCTKSGVANEILEHRGNALICNYESSESIYSNLLEMLKNKDLRGKITKQAFQDVKKMSFENKIQSILGLYSKLN